LLRELFISGVVIDDGYGVRAADIIIIGNNIVFGICNIDFDLTAMMVGNLLFVDNDLAAFFSIAGYIGNRYGKFDF
jgi:hypothetical protein